MLIPIEAYSFFPPLSIPRATENATGIFVAFEVGAGKERTLAWKYYQRYPERRVTRLNPAINNFASGRRLAIFVAARLADGRDIYFVDVAIEYLDARFSHLAAILFGPGVPQNPGAFVRLPLDVSPFVPDTALHQLLHKFDEISQMGWIHTLREGDTGVGYTFESLAGIEENNDKRADFRGIEIKSKVRSGRGKSEGKTNLFQQAPVWAQKLSSLERLKLIGYPRADGRYACHSQVTMKPNHLGLVLLVQPAASKVDMKKTTTPVGFWTYHTLENRLNEKHSRAAFVKADSRGKGAEMEYCYRELVYCERPGISNFIALVDSGHIVFEFLMHEEENGTVRNHGYPWRLKSQSLLSDLFAMRIMLRG